MSYPACNDMESLATALTTMSLDEFLLTKGRSKESGGCSSDQKLHKTLRPGEIQLGGRLVHSAPSCDLLEQLIGEVAQGPEAAAAAAAPGGGGGGGGVGFAHHSYDGHYLGGQDEWSALLDDPAMAIGAAWNPPVQAAAPQAEPVGHRLPAGSSPAGGGGGGSGGSGSSRQEGPDRSASTRDTLRQFLLTKNAYNRHMDSNFNSPLHSAVIAQRSSLEMELILRQLKEDNVLACVINCVNNTGHTPLSLSLKHRRPDLVRLLIDYNALPTYHCCGPRERVNHFHYALKKCLDCQGLETINALVSAVQFTCWDEFIGLAARNCNRKTPLEELELRVRQMRSCGQANPELMQQLRQLHSRLQQFVLPLHPTATGCQL